VGELPVKAMLGHVMPYLTCRNRISLPCWFFKTSGNVR